MLAQRVAPAADARPSVPRGRAAAQHGVLALQQAAGNRAVARMASERMLARGVLDSAESVIEDFCHDMNASGTGAVSPCAANPSCPPTHCMALPNRFEAIGIRNVVKPVLLAGIATKVSPRVVGLWDDYLGSGFSNGGDPAVRDLTATFGGDFARSPTTADTVRFLHTELERAVRAAPPTVAPGSTQTVPLSSLIPTAAAAIGTDGDPNVMDFDIPSDIPGNLAGGIGAGEAACRVGAHPSPQNDSRTLTGTATLTGNADGSVTVTPDYAFEVRDTIDLCPGNCGAALEQCATIILSRLEATGVAGDIAFVVTFTGPAQSAITVGGTPPPTPPAPPGPAPATGRLRAPRFYVGANPEPTLEACFEGTARLAQGSSRHVAVAMVQRALVDRGYDLGPMGADGIFGWRTARAVRQFKADEHLGSETVGDVGPGTMHRLDELFAP